jgi:predicted component of type VI protein secretion system
MKKIDREFLAKFQNGTIYLKSKEEIADSIAKEIGNILSSKLGWSQPFMAINFKDLPLSYGIRDIQSIGTSHTDLENFRVHCREAILNFEPRLRDLEINDVRINKETQSISLEITCYTKSNRDPPFIVNFKS